MKRALPREPVAPVAAASGDDGFRPDVEGLRGVAILLVVLFHVGLPVPGGFVGVDVFFVVSGFLITGLLLRERDRTGRISFSRFYARRIRRLLPAAAVALLITLPVACLLVAPLDRPRVALDGAAAALSVGNVRFALTTGDYFGSMTSPSPFLHFWSLGIEEQFYVVWPALLLAASAVRPRLGPALALGAVLLVSLTACAVVTDFAPTWAFYSLPTRAWQLAAGGLLAIASAHIGRLQDRVIVPLAWAGMVALLLAALRLDADTPYPGLAAVAPTAAAASLVACGMRSRGPAVILAWAPLRFLGRISYSLYLWHWPILVLAPLAVAGLDLWPRLGLAGVAVAVAWVSWRFIEEPFRRGLPRLSAHPRQTIAAGVAAMLAVILLATGLNASGDIVLAAGAGQAGPASPGIVPQPLATSGVGPAVSATPAAMSPADTDPAPTLTSAPAGSAASAATPGPFGAIPLPSSRPRASPLMSPGEPTPSNVAPTQIATSSPGPSTTSAPTVSNVLPADVMPSVWQARSDEERLRADRCLAPEGVTDPPDCVYGTPGGSFTVALVGDSHASHWFPAVEAIAHDQGWRLLTFVKVACPFIDMRVRDIYLKREYRECASWNDAVVARLAAARPDLVLVSISRWIFPSLEPDQDVGRQSDALARMLSRVPGRVTVIADLPMPVVDVPACLSAHPDDVNRCATSRRQAFRSDMLVRERAAASAVRAGFIDMTAAVCPGDPCPAIVGHVIAFRDTHHLTATFSRALAPQLADAIDEILPPVRRPTS